MSQLVVSLPSDPGLRDAVIAATEPESHIEFVEWDVDGPAPRERIDIVVPPYWGGQRRLSWLAGCSIGLVQWQSIGYNGLEQHVPAGVPVANAATVHETSTAELALTLTLAAQRGIADFVREGTQGIWHTRPIKSLADSRVLLIGYGGIGKAVEARLSGFEVHVTRLARTARTEQNLAGEDVQVHGFAALHERLAEADVVICAVPLTDETTHLLDAAALACLPDDALVVNVARGAVVDTEALLAELTAGRLRAALDVTDPEPLPQDHPLWSCPNALITPHVGGDSPAMLPRMVRLIQRQIGHASRGEQAENLVLGPGSPGHASNNKEAGR